jgi:hypothetical protein
MRSATVGFSSMETIDSQLPLGLFPPESLRPVYIEMVYSPDGRNAIRDSDLFMLAKGTGFFYRVDGQIYPGHGSS